MCWAKIEGKVLKVEHTKAFNGHSKESHLSSGEIDGDDGVCVREKTPDGHTLLANQMSKVLGKSQGHVTRLHRSIL